MSQFYGVCAGLVVSLPTWMAMRYLSVQVGVLVGVFLVTFVCVMTIYINSDETAERQETLTDAVAKMESVLVDTLRWIEIKIEALPESLARSESSEERLDTSVEMLCRILEEQEVESEPQQP